MRRSDVERLADIACDLDALANFFQEEARMAIKRCVDELHATARACAERLGVTIYADDDENEDEAR
jgi:hypothetical protein